MYRQLIPSSRALRTEIYARLTARNGRGNFFIAAECFQVFKSLGPAGPGKLETGSLSIKICLLYTGEATETSSREGFLVLTEVQQRRSAGP